MLTDDVGGRLAGLLHLVIIAMVRREGRDLTARQLGIFLTCYTDPKAQTVRGLAAQLHILKPTVTRALDRLEEFDLVRRKTDPLDRRSILVQRTAAGMRFLRELRQMLNDAAATADMFAERDPRAAGHIATFLSG
jgi:DNA-binding MarR family transcriptional regulator